MKNIFKIFTIFGLSMLLVQSCSKDDKIIDDVFDDISNGAILRVIEFVSADLPIGVAGAGFEVTLEEQDNQNGALFQQIDVFGDFAGGTKTFIKTVDASTFTTFADTGLPRGNVSVSLDELVAATGVDATTLNGGDVFNIHLDLVLTDGRVFNADNTNGNVSAVGGFYSSPFFFPSSVICPVPDTFMVGAYAITKTTTGEDPFFPNYGQAFTTAAQNLTIVAAGVDRTYTYPYYPTSFAIANNMILSLVCGTIQVAGSNGLSCNGADPVGQVNGTSISSYNLADDTVIDVDFNDFDPNGGCAGTSPYPVTLRFTKL